MEARAIRRTGAAVASVAVLLPALAGCGSSGGDSSSTAQQSGTSTFPQTSEPSNLDPADFSTNIDNPYWPMPVGATWHVHVSNPQGESLQETITVTDQTKRIADGVTARVVRDIVYDHGQPSEITDDWYAQDSDGNIWYFGENTAEIHNGERDTSGSFEAGRDGADAGVAMPAHPYVGLTYREEYYKGHAEDGASIISTDALAKVPYGRFEHGVQTRNFSGIEPDVIEEKIYAKGIGVVLEITVSGGSDRDELLSYREG